MNVVSIANQKSKEIDHKPSLYGRIHAFADIIDVKVIKRKGLALWKLMVASWVLRLGRCYKDDAVKAAWFIALLIGVIGGLFIGLGKFMDMDIHAQMPPLLSIVILCLYRIIEFMMIGGIIVYGAWELVQGCKWLTKWSENIKEKAREEAYRKQKENEYQKQNHQ